MFGCLTNDEKGIQSDEQKWKTAADSVHIPGFSPESP
jgi:hypothetical protein